MDRHTPNENRQHYTYLYQAEQSVGNKRTPLNRIELI